MISEFMDNLEDSYSGKFKDTEHRDIRQLIGDLDDDQRQSLYSFIKVNYTQQSLPKYGHIFKFMQNVGFLKKKVPASTSQLHPQSPYQMVLKYKDKPVEWLAEACRKVQQLSSEQLNSQRISFNYYWNYLLCVPDDFRNLMKEYIVEQEYSKIYDLLAEKGIKKDTKNLFNA